MDALRSYAEAQGRTLLELSFAWLLAHRPVASVIAGATSAEQVEANARAARWTLSDRQLAGVNEVLGV